MVSTKANTLHAACEKLLEEQVSLTTVFLPLQAILNALCIYYYTAMRNYICLILRL